MPKRPKRSISGSLPSVILVLVAIALLGHVIWKNHELIHKVFSHKIDVRFFGLAFCLYIAGTLLTFVRWLGLVRVVEPWFRAGVAVRLGFMGNLFNLARSDWAKK